MLSSVSGILWKEANELIKLVRSRVVDNNGTFVKLLQICGPQQLWKPGNGCRRKDQAQRKSLRWSLIPQMWRHHSNSGALFQCCCFSIRSRTVYPHYSLALLGSSCNWCFYGFPD
ncbi:uncharacterized protein LOC110692154 [Chenopodium quinoa]|uniref:uncharacterized protein LOC110692154 n=1 Tax=Chenopodium quinoa TaxID=63459 RepID=UPI000B79883E|nr:uncharacterized protein LOC110692154 [Chenopodium quinoa]